MKKIAVFASGQGSNFKNILLNQELTENHAEVVCLVTNKSEIGAIDTAESFGVSWNVISRTNFDAAEAYASALLDYLQSFAVDWIVLAGFLKKIPDAVVNKYQNKILNIHPALLPAFGGKGMYGANVHRAVFESGAKLSGPTVHLVNTEYDRGPIVMQEAVDISDCETPQEIAAAVLKREHLLFPKAILAMLTRKYIINHNRVNFI